MANRWVTCTEGIGILHEQNSVNLRKNQFEPNSVGLIQELRGDSVVIWLIGRDETWTVPASEVTEIDVSQTGDKFDRKICNVCHRILPVSSFARNQNNKHGILRRPSCERCRSDIDKRAPKSQQAKQMEKRRPRIGDYFKCPICMRRPIAGVTAKIVADHDHNTANIRDFICDSCNTGLGRFKNGRNFLLNAVLYIEERDKLI